MATNTWWNNAWSYRCRISSDIMGNAYTSGVHYLVQRINLRTLIDAGKVRPDGNDIRIVYQPSTGSTQEVMRYVASGNVVKSKIYFPAQNNIASGTNIGDQSEYVYYLYYGNAEATNNVPTWENLNFPQAPYSVHKDPLSGAHSGYMDKFLVRCTESGASITDYTENFSPTSTGNNLLYWEDGRLDRSIYIPATADHYIKVPYVAAHQKTNPSGEWHMDIWFKPAATLDGNDRRLISRYAGATTQTELYFTGTTTPRVVGAERSVSTANASPIVAGKWYFARAMGYSNDPDKMQVYLLSSGINVSTVNTNSIAPAIGASTSVFIGYLDGGAQFGAVHGHVEQARYGRFLYSLAPDGITNTWLPPDFVDPEFNLSLGSEEGQPATVVGYIGGYARSSGPGTISAYLGGYLSAEGTAIAGYLGGYVLTTSENYVTGLLGGYLHAQSGIVIQGIVGGYLFALPLVRVTGYLGGSTSGLNSENAYLGGYTFGMPDDRKYVETHARTLAKASSDNAVGQDLDIDAQLVLKALGTNDFNAQLILMRRTFSEFNAQLKVQKVKTRPTLVITDVSPASGVLVDGVQQVSVTASGTLGDANEFISATINFGAPSDYLNSVSGFSNAGPVWTSTHDYSASGVYIITARAVDNMGMVATDVYVLNLASGLTPGVDYPYIRITGTPRMGTVPPSLQVSFTTEASGVITSLGTYSNENLYWDFGNRETSHKISPKTYYSSPGWYAATARYKYVTTAGQIIWIGDTLRLGWNR